MATADLGIRIFLQDAFSGGFGGISQLLRGFTDGLSLASGAMGSSASKIAALSSSIESSGLLVEKYQADFAALQEQIAASQVAIEGLQGVGAVGQNLQADLAAGEVLTYEQAVEKAKLSLQELKAQGAIFTPSQEEQVVKANADLLMYRQTVADLEAQLPNLNLNKWMNADKITAVESEMAKYEQKITDTELKLQTLSQVGFDKQALEIDRATASQTKLAAAADATQAKIDMEIAKQEEMNAAIAQQELANAALMTSIGVLVGAGAVFLGLGMAMKTDVTDAVDLQESMIQVKIAFQATEAEANTLQTVIIDLANKSVFSSKEIADGFVLLAERGFSVEDVVKNHMGVAFTNFAEATKSEVVPAADLLSSTMQTFGAKASEATTYSDILTAAFYNGVPKISELQQGLQQAGGEAAAVGWKFSDLATAFDLLAKRGISGSQAGTSLRFMLASLVDPTAKVQQALSSLGIIQIHTNDAFETFRAKLAASGSAGTTAADAYDGTLKSLNQMYTAAQKIGGLHTDKSFYEWATANGILSDKLFDSQGKFKDLSGVVTTLGTALKGIKTPAEFEAFLGSMGGARSGKAFEALLRDLPQTSAQIDILEKKMHAQGTAAKDAADRTAGWAGVSKQLGTTFKDIDALIGAPIRDTITPVLKSVADGAGNLSNTLQHSPDMAKFFAGFMIAGTVAAGATVLGIGLSLVATAIGAISGPAAIVGGILLGLGMAVGVVASHWGQITQAIQPALQAFRQVGAFLGALLGPVIAAIGKDLSFMGKMFDGAAVDLVPLKQAFAQLSVAIAPLMPYIKMLGQALGATLVAVLLVLLGVLVAVASALIFGWTAALKGLINIVTGIVSIFTGLVLIVTGIIQLLGAVISAGFLAMTGHSDQALKNIRGAWNTVWTGIEVLVQGIWRVIVGLFQASIGVVIALVIGFASGIINYFTHLYTVLVGHSIIPDLCNGIIKWFSSLPGQVLGFITGLVSGAINRFQSLSSQALTLAQNLVGGFVNTVSSLPGRIMAIIGGMGGMLYSAGSNMIQMFANGITSSVSAVINSATGIATAIANILQHNSPPKSGPLAQGDKSMPRMMAMLAGGITDGTPLLTAAAQKAAAGVAQVFSSPTTARLQGLAGAVPAQSGAASTRPNEYHFHIEVGGKETAQFIMDDITKTLKLNGMSRLYR